MKASSVFFFVSPYHAQGLLFPLLQNRDLTAAYRDGGELRASLAAPFDGRSGFAARCGEFAASGECRRRLAAACFEERLKLFAAAAAQFEFRAVVEHYDVVAVEVLMQLADAFEIDD